MTEKKRIVVRGICLVIIAILMFAFSPKIFGNPENYSRSTDTLDTKKTQVLEMAAASTAASVAVTCIPGDTAMPIAEKLMDLSGYLMVIVTAIFFEKYLLTLTGILAFKWIIPICLTGFAIIPFFKEADTAAVLKKTMIKLTVFAIAIWAVVPVSVQVSDFIDNTYETSAARAIEEANDYADGIRENSEDESTLQKYLNNFSLGVNGYLKKIETVINNFIEATAVMTVTTCVLPLAVMAVYIWLIKTISGIDITVPRKLSNVSGAIGKKQK